MLISISGSQGVGKSVCISELQNLGYKVVERKTSRSILSDWGVTLSQVNNDRGLTISFQEEILRRKINDEMEACASANVWFTERSMADLAVYATVAVGKDNEYSEWLNQYYIDCKLAQASYRHVCYITGGHFAPASDGVRGINQHYSRMVDLMMLDTTRSMTETSLHVISTIHLEQRVKAIESLIVPISNGTKY